ncbi:hypothetical protein DL93DRAFT_1086454 [Clavulina sp. PMI_390]|nr:hypothetical protein DL93DRAFT_1086454 [Clavulina sp. PMI_390]
MGRQTSNCPKFEQTPTTYNYRGFHSSTCLQSCGVCTPFNLVFFTFFTLTLPCYSCHFYHLVNIII